MNDEISEEITPEGKYFDKKGTEVPVLLTSVFMVAVCGILYELLISTVTTYFLGSSILHFSLTIGLFMSAMGLGSYLSKFIKKNLLHYFVAIEILLGLIGGFSAIILHYGHTLDENYYIFFVLLTIFLGSLVGLEIPLVTRILKQYDNLRETIANVLAFDYLGSLAASVLFPLILLPYLGIIRTAALIGFINLATAFLNAEIFKNYLPNAKGQKAASLISVFFLAAVFIYSFQISTFFEQMIYEDEIIFSEQSPYQRIIVTKHNKNTRLFINGNLQFSTVDEYRYHEPLVHLPASLAPKLENVLILGGGDGLAVKELLKYSDIKNIDLVDLDKVITDLATENTVFLDINQASLRDKKVKIYNEDAYKFVEKSNNIYQLVIVDLPDPHDSSLGKLYSKEFYGLIHKILSADGVMITQSTSPFFAVKPFWCINATLSEVFPYVLPVNSYVPSFGPWGFNIGIKTPVFDSLGTLPAPEKVAERFEKHLKKYPNLSLRYLEKGILPKLLFFEEDYRCEKPEINRLENQKVVQFYEESWNIWE